MESNGEFSNRGDMGAKERITPIRENRKDCGRKQYHDVQRLQGTNVAYSGTVYRVGWMMRDGDRKEPFVIY